MSSEKVLKNTNINATNEGGKDVRSKMEAFFSRKALFGILMGAIIPLVLLYLGASKVEPKLYYALFAALGLFSAYIFFLLVFYFVRAAAPQTQSLSPGLPTDEFVKDTNEKVSNILDRVEGLSRNRSQNAQFLPEGFIQVQEHAIKIENQQILGTSKRYAVNNHIPSSIRSDKLSGAMAKKLYKNWKPANLLPSYTKLINDRSEAISRYVEAGGIFYDYFTESAFKDYILGATKFDDILDPPAEIISRLNRISTLLDNESYNIHVVDTDNLGPSMLLRIDVKNRVPVYSGLLIDLRTPGHSTDFENKSYGIYSTDFEVCQSTIGKIEYNMSQSKVIRDKVKIKRELAKIISWLDDPTGEPPTWDLKS